MTILFMKIKSTQGAKLALVATLLAVVVVLLGAFTRLVDAGLGCPDWPGCYGQALWPNEAHEIERAEKLFPDAPVEADKVWPEMVHRYFAGTLGVLIAVLAVIGWRNSADEHYPFRLPVLMLFVVVWQAMFGMWTVTLKLWPQVVTAHLMGGMTTLALCWLLTLRLHHKRWQLEAGNWVRLQKFRPWLIVGIIIVFLQIMLGGWTSANYAAFACPDFPTCHNEWLPAMDLSAGFNVFQSIGPNYLGGLLENDARVAIHFMHRVGALVTTIYLCILAASLWRIAERKLRQSLVVLFLVLVLQLTLGISNVLFQIPLPIAVAHNGGGALLLLTMVFLATRVWMAAIDPDKNSSEEAER